MKVFIDRDRCGHYTELLLAANKRFGKGAAMEHDISTFWSVVVEIGFIGWVSSTIAFIFKGIDKQNHLVKKNAVIFGILIVVFYALFVAGLVNA